MSERIEDSFGPLPRAIDAMPSVGEAVVTLVCSTVWCWPWVVGIVWVVLHHVFHVL